MYSRGKDNSYEFAYTKDCSKRTLFLPEKMLKCIFMWPNVDKRKRYIFYIICMSLFVFTQWGLANYLIANYNDYDKSLTAVSSMSTFFQSSLKLTILQYHSSSFDLLLSDISNKFWPYDLMADCAPRLKKNFYKTIAAMFMLSFSGILFSVGSITAPLKSSNYREIPYKCLYNFDTTATPIYEIMFLLHCFLSAYVINLAVLGFDFLYMGVGENLISQYILLGKSIERLGTPFVSSFNCKMRKLETVNIDQNAIYLRLFIKQHQIILGASKIAENVFNFIAALQLCSSVLAICVSAFISTRIDLNMTQIGTMSSYLIGHLIQLYLYCSIGNELLYESNNLTNYIFKSKWFEINNIKLKKDIVFVLKTAQVPAKITAFKVFPLDYSTYIKVLRLSFSFYTLLSSIVEIKN